MLSRFSYAIVGCLVVVTYAAPQLNYPAGTRLDSLPVKNNTETHGTAQSDLISGRKNVRNQNEETLAELQAKSAQYSYDSSIKDSISDQTVFRQETREGLALKGMYAYSDGFYKREVHYVADDKGYRVVKEISIPIGDGPQVDPNGKADVSSSLSGSYSITADDIARPVKKNAKKVDKI
ncbi:uncharacterized protein LOC129722284 [Wyeomyia smithii]|uniref:uncharacterized protein LOC129722284 n=1 Tax=Wyeomyia smithii TaxID=174621 RepID=UPI002467D374|nr:uncharacterized protein LOC129722284 [Wyeomyia smithii]